MTEAMKALDEIVDVLCKHLGPQVLNQDVASDIDIDRHDDFRSDMQEVAADILALPTLRAALAPPADGEVEAIRQRHEEYAAVWEFGDQVKQDYQYLEDAHADRATLLDRDARHVAEIARLSAELAAERERRVEVEGALNLVIYQSVLAPSDARLCANVAKKALNLETTNG